MPEKPFRILAIDVGGETSVRNNKPIENCFKLVLASQAVIVGKG